MPWFEATDTIRLASNTVVERGDLFEYPYQAGKALVAANRAEWSDPPEDRMAETSTADDAGESELEPSTEQSEPDGQDEESSDRETGDESVAVSEIDFTAIDGIGPSSSEDMAEWVDEQGIEMVDALLDEDLTEMPHVGPSTADDVREYLEGLV